MDQKKFSDWISIPFCNQKMYFPFFLFWLVIILGAVCSLCYITKFFLEWFPWEEVQDYVLLWSITFRLTRNYFVPPWYIFIPSIHSKRKYKYGTISNSRIATSNNRYGKNVGFWFPSRQRIIDIFTIWWTRSNYAQGVTSCTKVMYNLEHFPREIFRERIS